MNPTTEEKLAHSLTAEDTGLLPHLPYLLQDLWELGGSPGPVVALMQRHLPQSGSVLDLACGKGAMAVGIAMATGWRVKGVDLLPEFVQAAREKAGEHGVEALCSFAVGDANEAVTAEKGYDCVLFSAAGDVLGAPGEMLPKLMGTVKAQGYILLVESYLKEGGEDVRYEHGYLPYAEWAALFERLGLREVERQQDDGGGTEERDLADFAAIQRRAAELAAQYPEKKAMFEAYVQSQQNELHDIESSLENVVWLLQKEQ